MRVAQVMAGAQYGGAETFFIRLTLALHRAGLHQKVIIRTHANRAETLRRGGIEPVEAKFGGALDFATPRLLKRELAGYEPDIVLTWMNRASSMCPKGDWVQVGRQGGYYDLKHYETCTHIIGNTQDITDNVVKGGWPTERVHYLPNFVTEEMARPIPRQTFFTPDTVPLIVALGRLHENKAFDVLLEALARVPNAYLWIAGEGPRREELEKMAENLAVKPRVRFLGWRDDVAALLQTADLFVCPSRHEPLGNVVLEAWAVGKPIISTASEGPSWLIDDNVNGLIVPIDDHEGVGKAIDRLRSDAGLVSRLVENATEKLQKGYSRDAICDAYIDLFSGKRAG